MKPLIPLNKFYTVYFQFLLKYRWVLFIAILLLVIGLSTGVRHLRINGDLHVYFEKDNPQMQSLDKIQSEYEKTDNLLIVVAPKNKDIFTRNTLDFIEKMADSAGLAPFVSRVDAVTNYQNVSASDEQISIKNLVENAINKTPEELAQIKKTALGDSIILKRLISTSGDVAGIFITVNFPKKDFVNEGPQLIAHINRLLEKYKRNDIDVYLTGTVMVDNAFAESGAKDMATLIPIMILLIIAFVYFFSRSWISTLSSLFIVLCSAVVGMGVIGLMGVEVTSSLTSGPVMIMTIVIADGIHFFTSVVLAMKRGLNKNDAIQEGIQLNFVPLLLTTISTVIGFVSMNLSDSPPFRDLGNLVSIGSCVGWILSIVWLPCLLLILPFNPQRLSSAKVKAYNFDFIGVFVTRNYKRIILATVLSTAVLTPFVFKNKLNDMFLDFFSDELKIKKDTQFTVDHLTGIYTLEYSLGAGENGVTSLAYLKKLEEFENWFNQQPKVMHVSSIVHIIKKLNMVMHGNDKKAYRLPDNDALCAQYLLMYELSLPQGSNLTNQINLDKSASRFRVTFENMYTEDLKKIELSANKWLKDHAPHSMYFDGTSTSVMFRYLSERNIQFMIEGFAIGVITIVVFLIFATRSFKIGLVTFFPNVLPTLIAFCIWGMLVGKVGLAVAFVTSFTLGIVVDNTIHFIVKYKLIRKQMGLSPEEAVVKAFEIAGSSMFVSTLILVFGFLVLVFSPFQLNSSMGILSALTLALSLAYDFLLTPSLVLMIEKGKERRLAKNSSKNLTTQEIYQNETV